MAKKQTDKAANEEVNEILEETAEETAEQTEENEADKVKAELKELEEKYFRLAAEYDNFKRRTQKEKEALYNDSVSDVIAQLLPLFDTIGFASVSANADDTESVAKGIAMMEKMASDVLLKLEVEAIESVGKEFDANLHNAVMHIDDENFRTNEVVEEFQKGYKRKDKVIRYSMVKVAN